MHRQIGKRLMMGWHQPIKELKVQENDKKNIKEFLARTTADSNQKADNILVCIAIANVGCCIQFLRKYFFGIFYFISPKCPKYVLSK